MYLKSLRHELLTSHIHICSRIGNAKTILHIGLGVITVKLKDYAQ